MAEKSEPMVRKTRIVQEIIGPQITRSAGRRKTCRVSENRLIDLPSEPNLAVEGQGEIRSCQLPDELVHSR